MVDKLPVRGWVFQCLLNVTLMVLARFTYFTLHPNTAPYIADGLLLHNLFWK